jgi:hypothetical protein
MGAGLLICLLMLLKKLMQEEEFPRYAIFLHLDFLKCYPIYFLLAKALRNSVQIQGRNGMNVNGRVESSEAISGNLFLQVGSSEKNGTMTVGIGAKDDTWVLNQNSRFYDKAFESQEWDLYKR